MTELDKYEKEAASKILDRIDTLNDIRYSSTSARSGIGMMVGNMLTSSAVVSMNIEMTCEWVIDAMKVVRLIITDVLDQESPTWLEESEAWLTAVALYRIVGLQVDDWLVEELENSFMPNLKDVIFETHPSELTTKLREIRQA